MSTLLSGSKTPIYYTRKLFRALPPSKPLVKHISTNKNLDLIAEML